MATIGRLNVSLGLNSAKLVSELQKSAKRLQGFAKQAKAAAKLAAAGFAVLGTAITAGVIVAVNKTAAALDSIIKKSRALGIAVDELRRLQYVAELSGVSAAQLDKSFTRMLKSIGDARAGLSTATDALDIIGVSLADLDGQAPSEQFRIISEGLAGVEDKAMQTKAAMDLFGRSGSDLTNLFSADIRSLFDDFDALGLKISDSQAAAIENFNDSKTRFKALFGGFAEQLTGELAGPFAFVINKITESVKEMGGMRVAAKKFAGFILTGMKMAASAIGGAIRLVLQLRGFLLSTQLFARSLGETVAANIDKVKDFAVSPVFGIAKGMMGGYDETQQQSTPESQALADAIIKNQKQIDLFDGGDGAFAKWADELEAGLDEAFTKGAPDVAKAVEDGARMGVESAKVKVDLSKFTGTDGSIDYVAAARATIDSNLKLSQSAKNAAVVLDEVAKSKAWQDIFGKEDVTARAADFDTYAKMAKEGIESGSVFAGDSLNTLKQILAVSRANQGNVFTNQGTIGEVDLTGMQSVISGLEALRDIKGEINPESSSSLQEASLRIESASKMVTDKISALADKQGNVEPVGSLSIDLTTDTDRVAGEIFGKPAFLRNLQDFIKRNANNAAREVGS